MSIKVYQVSIRCLSVCLSGVYQPYPVSIKVYLVYLVFV